MEMLTILAIILIALYIMRKSINKWTTVSELASSHGARKIAMNIKKEEIKLQNKATVLKAKEPEEKIDLDDFLGL